MSVDVDLDDLRRQLAAAPSPAGDPALAIARAHRTLAARRHARRSRMSITAAVLVVAVVGGGIGLVQGGAFTPVSSSAPAAQPPVAAWPARGDLVHDPSLPARAAVGLGEEGGQWGGPFVWDRLLYAGRSNTPDTRTIGAVAVVALVQDSATGHSAAALLTAALPPDGDLTPVDTAGPLLLRSVVPLDTAQAVAAIGFATPRSDSTDTPASTVSDTLLVALLNPQASSAKWESAVLDAPLTDGSDVPAVPADGLLLTTLFPDIGPWNATLTVTGAVGATPIGTTPDGAPSTASIAAVHDGGAAITITSAATPLRTGQIVAVPAGLIGIITAVDGQNATVTTDLTALTRAGADLMGYGTSNHGSITGTPGAYRFLRDDPTDSVNHIVLVGGPDQPGTVNIGAVSVTPEESSASAWRLMRSVDPADLTPGMSVLVGLGPS